MTDDRATGWRGWVILAASLGAIVIVTLRPNASEPWAHEFWSIRRDDAGGLVDIALNVALFFPYGIALRQMRRRTFAALALIIATTAAIECLQYVVIAGRDGTIRDVLTNSLGGIAGYAIQPYVRRLLRPDDRLARKMAWAGATAWVAHAILAAAMFLPSGTDSAYWGQWAAHLLGLDKFSGAVLSASVDGSPLADGRLDAALQIRIRADSMLEMIAQVTPGIPSRRLAPILSIADEDGNGIAMIAQQGSDLVFRTRLRANRWRLGAPAIVLPNGVPRPSDASVNGTTRLTGRLHNSVLEVGATEPTGVDRRVVLPLTPSLGWSLWWTPFHVPGPATVATITWIWLAGPLAVIGLLCVRGLPPGPHRLGGLTVALAPLLTGVVCAHIVVPVFLGPGLWPLLHDGYAIATGAAIGLVVGSIVRRSR